MRLPTTQTYQYVGIGALLGGAAALFASAVMLSRKDRLTDYLRQNGDASGDTESSIQEHDEEVFRGELASAHPSPRLYPDR